MFKINSKTLELYIYPAVLVVLLLIPHILFFNNGYVDLEGHCVYAGSQIAQYGINADLTSYFYDIFNPIFSVLILGGSYKIFGESEVVSRLTMSALAFAFSLFLYFYLRKKKNAVLSFTITLLVVVNPMFIVYSQYIYSDTPFMIFVSIALLLLLFSDSSRRATIISSIMLGISLATKYVALIIFPTVVIYSFIKQKLFPDFSKHSLFAMVRFNLWYFALALLVSLPFILVALNYQDSIIPSRYETVHTFGVSMFIPRFFSYILWLGLFVGPSCLILLFDLWNKMGKKKTLILLFSLTGFTLIVSYFFPISSLHIQSVSYGEMNLGWVESTVPSPVLSVLFFFVILIGEFLIASLAFDFKNVGSEEIQKLFFWIVIPLVLMPFTRVANRYMLVLLVPLSLYTTHIIEKMYDGHRKSFILAVLVLHVLIFLSVGFYSNYYLHLRGLS